MLKKFRTIFVFLFAVSILFVLGNTVLAVDTGINSAIGIGLGDTDPRVVAANVIRVFLGFLGIIALFLILYAGVLWTTSAGDSAKIDKAKKILISAVIGLLIVLSSFAIASFILSKLLGATTIGGSGGPGGPGGGIPGGGGSAVVSCDGNTLTPSCDPDNTFCASGTETCDPVSCTCQPLGGVGDSCDSDTTNAPICDPDDTLCQPGLSCDGTSCLCFGDPIIDWVSPVDDLGTPNGAVGDFVTIGGRFFGTSPGVVYFSDASGNPLIPADSPSAVNPNCNNNWNDNEIIVVVPVGAFDGPIRVERADAQTDDTNDSRGPNIDDFLINTTNRPGLCLATPALGYFETGFGLEGVRFTGANQGVYFGNDTSSTSAIGINFLNDLQVNAQVPNISGGNRSIFVSIYGFNSNALDFSVLIDNSRRPTIDYMDPNPTVPGQYVTIFGRNFGRIGVNSNILFTDGFNAYPISGSDFPSECQDSWWRDAYIIIKTPENIRTDNSYGDYNIIITNNDSATSTPSILSVELGDPGPGICKIDPDNGPVATSPVNLYGDNFTATPGTASFYDSVNAPTSAWVNQNIITSVPPNAKTGPVAVIATARSNELPFRVGSCDPSIASTDSNFQCDLTVPQECCGGGTYWDGVCRTDGTCDLGGGVVDSGYGWTYIAYGTSTAPLPTGTPCYDGGATCNDATNPVCGSGQFCDNTSCTCQPSLPLPPTGTPCYDGGATCNDSTNPVCSSGQFCDNTSCTCQPEATYPGEACVQEVNIGPLSVFTCDPSFACGAGYSCLNDIGGSAVSTGDYSECGTCCCTPGTFLTTADGDQLLCQPDKSPCGGASRGLFCGCESDLECGDTNTNACGGDTCCRPRPRVTSTSPPDEPDIGSTNVCRNVLLEATFNTEMDTSTFKGNMILLGDYGNDPCPEGTQYLTIDDSQEKDKKKIFVRSFNSIKEKISSLIFDEASAYGPVVATNNFCAIRGKTDGHNNTAGQGVLTFAPNRALDGDIRHYAIILGDADTTDDIAKGVQDRFAVSMGTNGTTILESFNSLDYENSYIWSFVTLSEQGENQGLCTIDYVDVQPSSYLFQTTENSLVEDDNPLADSFDSERDADKEFVAMAKTLDGQSLNRVNGLYDWAWSWWISNPGVVNETGAFAGAGNKRLIRAQDTATEGSATVEATATIIPGSIVITGPHTGVANVYLFLCNNPWPPISTTGSTVGQWSPWQDEANNCTIYPDGPYDSVTNPNTCINSNYEFYYCRDQGSESTFDDLPPILNDAVIRGKDNDQNLFKEYYFFREATPDLSTTVLAGTVPVTGSSIDLAWTPFGAIAPEVLDHFVVYYGTIAGNYTDTVSVGPGTFATSITGLDNNKTYYFAITAVYESGAESDFTNEINIVPKDTQSPAVSTITSAAIGNTEAEIEWSPVLDASSYKLYWKAGSSCSGSTPPDCYASSQNVGNATAASITDLTNGTIYYFSVTVIDSSGNESAYSNEVSVIPAVTSATVISGATQVALGWISANLVSQDDIYYIDMGTIAGIFEEYQEMEGNRINLFGDIIKYIIKKISYSFINSAEAQVAETRIPLCGAGSTEICRDDIIENNGRHSTIIKNLNSGRKYRFIIKNGSTDNQRIIDDFVVEMKDSAGTEISFGKKCYLGSVCESPLVCQPSGGLALVDQSACCNNDQCVSVYWQNPTLKTYGVECISDGIVTQTLDNTGTMIAQECVKGDWVDPLSS